MWARTLQLLLVSICFCVAASEPIIGGPCDGCEYVFVDIPASLASTSRIAPIGEEGEALVLAGTVRDADGALAAGIVVYAYQTNSGGVYPEGTTRHGSLRAWARTDDHGRYEFRTIRPGAYPEGDNPQHIHMHVIEPGKAAYYVDDVVFDDDPLLTATQRERMRRGRGGDGVTHPERDTLGTWRVRRDIILGREIPGYHR